MNDHARERTEDLRDRKEVASIHNFDFSFIKWGLGLIGTIALIILSVFGWSLTKIYDLGSQVSGHTALLESLQSGQADIKSQVSAIYQFELNKTDSKTYIPTRLPMNVSLGSTTASLNL